MPFGRKPAVKKKDKASYHHGDLAESFLDAVDTLATQFGLDAVTLRACAKLVGVAPSAAFRHFADKRSLFTAFAARALTQLAEEMSESAGNQTTTGEAASHVPSHARSHWDAFRAVGESYVRFSLENPAFFRVMWRRDLIYADDPAYLEASNLMRTHLQSGFAETLEDEDADTFSAEELLAWSSVHGIAALMIDGPLSEIKSIDEQMRMAEAMIARLGPALMKA